MMLLVSAICVWTFIYKFRPERLSISHSTFCLLAPLFPYECITCSMAYFMVDAYMCNKPLWMLHHSLSIGLQVMALYNVIDIYYSKWFLFCGEIGALAFHIAKLYKKNKTIRLIYVIGNIIKQRFLKQYYTNIYIYKSLFRV